ncbi:MAG: RluA family pseudouridine synthase [Oscillospiraceae bacterium]
MNIQYYTYEHDNPILLKDFLKSVGISKKLLTKLKNQDMGITRDGKLIRAIDLVYKNDTIKLSIEDTSFLEPNGNLKVEIPFQDNNVIVFDKPFNMPVHPSIKHQGDTLGNYFAYLYPDKTFRPIIRLDRNTSGLCIVAKNQRCAGLLQKKVQKVYYAVVNGLIDDFGTINAPIKREDNSIIKRIVSLDGQPSITHYKRLSYNGKYSLVEITLETGRTHQIRVHFSHIGHPLAGDDLYGGNTEDIKRHALHCGKLIFPNVDDNYNIIEVNSPIPSDMKSII